MKIMELTKFLYGQRRMVEMLVTISQREPVYSQQLIQSGWNNKTVTNVLRRIREHGLVTYKIKDSDDSIMRKWYRLTPKGREVVKLLIEIEKVLENQKE